jgi:Ribbon-helix-helix protein, copG family
MGQINVTVDDILIANVDRVAAATGKSRPDLLRQMMAEMFEAHDAGRLAFSLDDGPRLDTSLNTLAVQLREAVVEIDRSQRENQKLTKRLIDSWNGGEEAAQAALERLSQHIVKTNKEGYTPFVDALTGIRENVTALSGQLAADLDVRMDRLGNRLDAIRKSSEQPRTATYLYLSSQKRIWLTTLIATHVIALIAGLFVGLFTADTRDQASMNAVTTPVSACRLVNQVFEAKDCKVPEAQRKSVVARIAEEDRP